MCKELRLFLSAIVTLFDLGQYDSTKYSGILTNLDIGKMFDNDQLNLIANHLNIMNKFYLEMVTVAWLWEKSK